MKTKEFKSPNGYASFWAKDGCWHVAIKAGAGGLRYTEHAYATQEEAVEQIRRLPSWRVVNDPEEIHQYCGYMAVLGGCGPSGKREGKFWWRAGATPCTESIGTEYADSLEECKNRIEEHLVPFVERMTLPKAIQPATHEARAQDKEQAVDEEQLRWQNRIDDIICKNIPGGVDGSGCDSGDPLDLTATEIDLAFGKLKEQGAQDKARIAGLLFLMEAVEPYVECPELSKAITAELNRTEK